MYAAVQSAYTVQVHTMAIAEAVVASAIGGLMIDILRSGCIALAMLLWCARAAYVEKTHDIPDAAVVAGMARRRTRPSRKRDDRPLLPDPLNANRGTERHGTIIAGNHT